MKRKRPCVYCGRLCHGKACWLHADLIRLDPNYDKAAA